MSKPIGEKKPKLQKAKVEILLPEFFCDFCKRPFSSEKRLLSHMCEEKRRVLQRQERHVLIAYSAYVKFWKKCQNPKQTPKWEDFEKTNLYLAFVKFGRYIFDNNVIKPEQFVDFLLRSQIGIDDWCKPSHYNLYIREMRKLEDPYQSVKDNILLMESWALKNNESLENFFSKVSTSQAVLWILSGRLSPLMLFVASTANKLIDRLNEEQNNLISSVIDEKFWEIKMEQHSDIIKIIIDELKSQNI